MVPIAMHALIEVEHLEVEHAHDLIHGCTCLAGTDTCVHICLELEIAL
jgi:hypothetical protein